MSVETLNIVDLFSGSGAIGFYLAKHLKTPVQSIEFVEISPDVVENWEFTKKNHGLLIWKPRKMDAFNLDSAVNANIIQQSCVVVVVNCLKGYGEEVLEALITIVMVIPLSVLVYVSANFQTFLKITISFKEIGLKAKSYIYILDPIA